MSKEKLWQECLEDFLVGADGKYEHSESSVIKDGRAATNHTLYADRETLSWDVDNKTKEIIEVEHLGR